MNKENMFSWSPIIAALSGILGTILGALIVHITSLWREREKKNAEVRIEYLIDSWMKIEKASNTSFLDEKERKEVYENLESSIARIMILGNKIEIEAASKFANELANGNNKSVNELLDTLMNSLRSRLDLEEVGRLQLFFRMRR